MRLLVTDLAQTVDLQAQFCWVAIVILPMLADEQHVCVQLTLTVVYGMGGDVSYLTLIISLD